jgi:hypothetical protein
MVVGEWESLQTLSHERWIVSSEAERSVIAPMVCDGIFNIGLFCCVGNE